MATQQTGFDHPLSTWSRQLTAQLLQRLPSFYIIMPDSRTVTGQQWQTNSTWYSMTQFASFSNNVHSVTLSLFTVTVITNIREHLTTVTDI